MNLKGLQWKDKQRSRKRIAENRGEENPTAALVLKKNAKTTTKRTSKNTSKEVKSGKGHVKISISRYFLHLYLFNMVVIWHELQNKRLYLSNWNKSRTWTSSINSGWSNSSPITCHQPSDQEVWFMRLAWIRICFFSSRSASQFPCSSAFPFGQIKFYFFLVLLYELLWWWARAPGLSLKLSGITWAGWELIYLQYHIWSSLHSVREWFLLTYFLDEIIEFESGLSDFIEVTWVVRTLNHAYLTPNERVKAGESQTGTETWRNSKCFGECVSWDKCDYGQGYWFALKTLCCPTTSLQQHLTLCEFLYQAYSSCLIEVLAEKAQNPVAINYWQSMWIRDKRSHSFSTHAIVN